MTDDIPFLASGERRRTDRRILDAILQVADGDEELADRIWGAPSELELIDILVLLQNLDLDPEQLAWPPMGLLWHRAIQEII